MGRTTGIPGGKASSYVQGGPVAKIRASLARSDGSRKEPLPSAAARSAGVKTASLAGWPHQPIRCHRPPQRQPRWRGAAGSPHIASFASCNLSLADLKFSTATNLYKFASRGIAAMDPKLQTNEMTHSYRARRPARASETKTYIPKDQAT
ncbi:hypothetical protein PGT21_031880 [Puccinia graminis f. sp. tritici]|uniref:Uncharacterized protein n=1 Tax=Puccinia graminis f. sp. tritici TaxID=56615 RepID=A0A5B0PMB5_PUCGR|nr:hypothetical protein PGT21_031880 [Puccinia graminis f. sp. tritici]